ncbi:YbaM family protein [Psychromonas sp. PT13]|uniref:YbaM family protein n=1 Tax=Psychromonas sp. PT13 TaxID=3439547 RepID=UPI003EC04829
MTKTNNQNECLANASPSIKLAVDLIQLLEENQIETEVALEALEIVTKDFKRKQCIDSKKL